MTKPKRGKYIFYLVRFAVAASALYLAFRGEDLSGIGRTLISLNPRIVILGVGVFVINQALFVVRWTLLLKAQSINIGYWVALRLYLLGKFYNNCLPSAVGGDLLRAWYVTTHTDKKLEAALSVFVDRLVGISGMVLMAALCYWLIPVGDEGLKTQLAFESDPFKKLFGYWPVAAGAAAIILLITAGFFITAKGRTLMNKYIFSIRHSCIRVLKKGHKAIVVYWNHKAALLSAYLLTFSCQGILIVGMLFVGHDIGMDCPVRYYFVFFPIAWIVSSLPISVGGLGVWEETLKLMFVGVGMDGEQAIALAIFYRILLLLSSLPGMVIHLCGAHLPKEFSVDYLESER